MLPVNPDSPPNLFTNQGGSGFLVTESDRELEVVGIYVVYEKTGCETVPDDIGDLFTRGKCNGAGAGIDVEYVKPRVITPPALPDLRVIISGVPVEWCDQNGCRLAVTYAVVNDGDVAVLDPFIIRIQRHRTPPYLDPGVDDGTRGGSGC